MVGTTSLEKSSEADNNCEFIFNTATRRGEGFRDYRSRRNTQVGLVKCSMRPISRFASLFSAHDNVQ